MVKDNPHGTVVLSQSPPSTACFSGQERSRQIEIPIFEDVAVVLCDVLVTCEVFHELRWPPSVQSVPMNACPLIIVRGRHAGNVPYVCMAMRCGQLLCFRNRTTLLWTNLRGTFGAKEK